MKESFKNLKFLLIIDKMGYCSFIFIIVHNNKGFCNYLAMNG